MNEQRFERSYDIVNFISESKNPRIENDSGWQPVKPDERKLMSEVEVYSVHNLDGQIGHICWDCYRKLAKQGLHVIMNPDHSEVGDCDYCEQRLEGETDE